MERYGLPASAANCDSAHGRAGRDAYEAVLDHGLKCDVAAMMDSGGVLIRAAYRLEYEAARYSAGAVNVSGRYDALVIAALGRHGITRTFIEVPARDLAPDRAQATIDAFLSGLPPYSLRNVDILPRLPFGRVCACSWCPFRSLPKIFGGAPCTRH